MCFASLLVVSSGNRLGICFYAWRSLADQRCYAREQLRRALMHWMGGLLGRSFNQWKELALYKVRASYIPVQHCCTLQIS